MTDQEFQAGMISALTAAKDAFLTSSGYGATNVSGTLTYTPPVTVAPPAETITF